MKILLTGASGLIGSELLPRLLTLGHEVTTLTRKPLRNFTPSTALSQVHLDLLSENISPANCDAEVLIHLAWITTPGVYWTSPDNLRWQQASVNLVQEFLAAGGRRVIVAGSCAEYPWDNNPCYESRTPRASSAYSQAKLATRAAISRLCEVFGADLVWGRVFFPYGPGEAPQRLLPSVLSAMLVDAPVACSHGRQRRDFIHVRDVAAAFAHLSGTRCAPGDYNISSGRSVAIRDIVSLCQAATRSTSVVNYGEISVADNDPDIILGPNEKLRATGWMPCIDLEAGIADYVQHLGRHE